jgi:hypothetical protein
LEKCLEKIELPLPRRSRNIPTKGKVVLPDGVIMPVGIDHTVKMQVSAVRIAIVAQLITANYVHLVMINVLILLKKYAGQDSSPLMSVMDVVSYTNVP